MTQPILIVDDEPAIRRLVRGALERQGLQADEASTGKEALDMASRAGCELVMLDLGLPDRDGLDLVPLLKAMDRAVIVLTARYRTDEKVAALDLGADDYVTKPFDTAELLARVRTARRHHAGRTSAAPLQFGNVTFDPEARRVTRRGEEIHLTPKEFALFAELARYAGRVLTHQQLLTAVWGEAHTGDVEYLRVTMRGLRGKLEANPGHPSLLLNDPGIGYRLVSD